MHTYGSQQFLLQMKYPNSGKLKKIKIDLGTSINDVPRFLAIFDLPTLS